jgi:hypothetical protein
MTIRKGSYSHTVQWEDLTAFPLSHPTPIVRMQVT